MDHLQLEVVNIVPETRDAATIYLKNVDDTPILYQAGQFLTLMIPLMGRELRRSYSISATPGVDDFLCITVKRVANGEVSRYLLDHLQVGDILYSLPPSGRFTLATNHQYKRQVFFLAAGSGMVPVFSLLKKVLKEPGTQVTLISQDHNEDSTLFKKSLQLLAAQHAVHFKWFPFFSKPKTPGIIPERLTNLFVESLLDKTVLPASDHLFYLCGPPAFMLMVQFTLRQMGYPEEQIKKEHFTARAVPPPPLLTDTGPKKITIHFPNQTFHITTSFPTTILQAALNNHIPMPYSCRAGRCSTCIAKCTQGKIKMGINEVLTDKDLEQGLILTCVGYAETDITLEL